MLRGVDISMYQGVGAGDGYDFVIIKATEGNCYTDPTCDQHYQRAKANGQLRGFYHFARPDGNDPISEADWFVDQCLGYFKDGIPVLDWEVETWNVGWAKQWLDRVYERTGVRPLIYMSASVVWSNNWSEVSPYYGLWIAGYPAQYDVPYPPDPAENELPYDIGSWAFAVMWQYTSSAGSLDKDVAYIDAVAWSKYAGSYVEPQPVAEPTPAPQPEPEPVKEEPKVEEHNEEPISSSSENGTEPVVEEKQDTEVVDYKEPETTKKVDMKEYNKAMKKLQKKGETVPTPFTLPTKVYEVLRWLLIIVIPASLLFLGVLNDNLNWNLPMDAIKNITEEVEVFLGVVFGISYVANKVSTK